MAFRRRSPHPDMNLNELDYSISHEICQNFDVDRAWEQLAAVIGYSTYQMKVFELEINRPDGSPAKKLLWDWGTRGGTVRDLYHKLAFLNKTHVMRLLEPIMLSGKEEKGKRVSADVPILKEALDAPSLPPPSACSSSVDNCDKNYTTSYDPTSLPMPPPPRKKRETSPGLRKPEDINLNKMPGKDGKNSEKLIDKLVPVFQPGGGKYCPPDPGASSVHVNNCHAAEPASGKGNLGGASAPSLERVKSMVEEYGSGLNKDEKDIAVAMLGTLNFTYKELSQATDGFSEQRKLGQGTFGAVFQGTVTNTKCAIKRLFQKVERNDKDNQYSHLSSELKALTKFRHENIVALYGYALDGDEVCLVYQFMPNGSLEDCLHSRNGKHVSLSWQQRIVIASGASCGIQFLHNVDSKPLIHGDIKSANILLDRHYDAKIGDLGLAQHATGATVTGEFTHITKKQRGSKMYQSRAYLAPEIQRGSGFSIKGDTYAFGVVLFEILTGFDVHDERREGPDAAFLVGYIQQEMDSNPKLDYQTTFQDKRAGGLCPKPVFDGVFKLAEKCTKDKKKDRPTMTQVHRELEELETAFHQLISKEEELGRQMVQMTLKTVSPATHETPASNMSSDPNRTFPNSLPVTGPPSVTLNTSPVATQSANTVLSPIECLPKDQPLPEAFRMQVNYDKTKPHKDEHVYANIASVPTNQGEVTSNKSYRESSTAKQLENDDVPKADTKKLREIQQFDRENMAGGKFDNNYKDVSPCYANLPPKSDLFPSDPSQLPKEQGQPSVNIRSKFPGQETDIPRQQGATEPQESEDVSDENSENACVSTECNESLPDTPEPEGKTANEEMMALFNNYQQAVDEEIGNEMPDEEEYNFEFELDIPEEESDTLTESSAQANVGEPVYVNITNTNTVDINSKEDEVSHHRRHLAEYQTLNQAMFQSKTGAKETDIEHPNQTARGGDTADERASHLQVQQTAKQPSEGDCFE